MKSQVNSIKKSKVLIGAMTWGLGHLMRIIPIIEQLIKQDCKIYFAGDENQKKALQRYFDKNIEHLYLAPYPFNFSGKGNWTLDILKQSFSILKFLKHERKWTEKTVSHLKIDTIISDHRYQFFSEKCKSIFITHQINLPIAKYQFITQKVHQKSIFKFDQIWVPDYSTNQLSGKLSKSLKNEKIKYIGPLSRFKKTEKNENDNSILIVINGPYPYNQKLLKTAIGLKSKKQIKLIASDVLIKKINIPDKMKVIDSGNYSEIEEAFQKADTIIAYAGYSTIMDLHVLSKKAILIPTEKQKEQIYLSKLHKSRINWRFTKLDELSKINI